MGVTDVVASDDNEVGVAVVPATREEVGVAIVAPEPARAFSAGCWRGITTGRVVEIYNVCVCVCVCVCIWVCGYMCILN